MRNQIKESILANSNLYKIICDKFNDNSIINYLHPLSNNNISGKLKMRVKNVIYDSSTEFLQKQMKEENLCLEKFNEALQNDGINPHNEEYEPKKFYLELEHTKEIKETILYYLKNLKEYNKPIIQCGERGVGKTLLQNMILYDYTKVLEENKIFWVRCDAHKLYELWSKTHTTRSTIDDYHRLQLLYVFSKYYDDTDIYTKLKPEKKRKSDMFSDIFKKLKDKEANDKIFCKENSVRHLIEGKYIYLKLSDSIEKFRYEIYIAEKGNNKRYSYMLDKLLSDYQTNTTNEDKSFSKWMDTSNFLIKFLAHEGYMILNIVDGIDNINFSGDPQTLNYYPLLLEEIANLVYLKPYSENVSTYFCMREDTLCDLRSKLACTTNTDGRYYNEDQIITIHQKKPFEFTEVLNRRIDYFLKKNEKNSLIKDTQMVNLFKELKDMCIDQNFLIESNKSINNYIDIMSVRDFLHFQYGMLRLILLRKNQSHIDYSLSTQTQYFRLFKRNLFLNGRLYLNSTKSYFFESNEGRFFYNIFFSNTYHHLCTLRILQILSIVKIDRSVLILFLQYSLDYPLSTINNSLRYLSSFNLIKPEINNDKINENNSYSAQYKTVKYTQNELIDFSITEKGRILTKLIFSDIEILYLLSLDTQVPEWFIPDFIDSFDNNPESRSYYIPNCLKSGVSFLNLLKVIDKKELNIMKERIEEYNENQLLSSTSKIGGLINTIVINGLDQFSIENIINYKNLTVQIDIMFSKIQLEEEKEKLMIFTNNFL